MGHLYWIRVDQWPSVLARPEVKTLLAPPVVPMLWYNATTTEDSKFSVHKTRWVNYGKLRTKLLRFINAGLLRFHDPEITTIFNNPSPRATHPATLRDPMHSLETDRAFGMTIK